MKMKNRKYIEYVDKIKWNELNRKDDNRKKLI